LFVLAFSCKLYNYGPFWMHEKRKILFCTLNKVSSKGLFAAHWGCTYAGQLSVTKLPYWWVWNCLFSVDLNLDTPKAAAKLNLSSRKLISASEYVFCQTHTCHWISMLVGCAYMSDLNLSYQFKTWIWCFNLKT